jgi:peptidoglycan hydrolase-like protein with peptidoglycan-binding domain
MTASTLSRLPLAAGGVLMSGLGRAGIWTFSRYMRSPFASTGLLAMTALTAMAATNALYSQPVRHPAPFFAPAGDVPVAVNTPSQQRIAPIPQPLPELETTSSPTAPQTTASVPSPAQPQAIPDQPVGNSNAFAVQKKLAELGLFSGTVDGFYGPMTANAIRAFEVRNNMVVTGDLNPEVIEAILSADAAGIAPQASAAPVAPVQPTPVQQVAVVAPQPAPAPLAAPSQQLTPIDNAVDVMGNAAAQTIDSLVAAVGGDIPPRTTPPAALPLMPVAQPSQPMPAPVQMAALSPVAPVFQPATAAPETTSAIPEAQPETSEDIVSQIQRGLASLGFYHGAIDGRPGEATARSIREFENFHSYQVTGQINPDLVELLRGAGASI